MILCLVGSSFAELILITLISINIAEKKEMDLGHRVVTTGIFKDPVQHEVQVGKYGLEADAVCDDRHHGGLDQAVYIYRAEDYDWWSNQLQQPITPGTFGENLTIRGIAEPELMIGDRVSLGTVLLEITAPRIPCSVFSARMGKANFLKAFLKAERSGFYCRVLTPGALQTGASGAVITTELDSISTNEFYRDLQQKISAKKIEKYLSLPIDERSRRDFQKQLQNVAKS